MRGSVQIWDTSFVFLYDIPEFCEILCCWSIILANIFFIYIPFLSFGNLRFLSLKKKQHFVENLPYIIPLVRWPTAAGKFTCTKSNIVKENCLTNLHFLQMYKTVHRERCTSLLFVKVAKLSTIRNWQFCNFSSKSKNVSSHYILVLGNNY